MFSAFAAYAFTFLEFRFKEVYFAVIVGLLVVPVQIALIPVLQTYKAITAATGIQITGTFAAAWIVHSAFALPLCIFILRNYMSTLPVALIEAARVDGARISDLLAADRADVHSGAGIFRDLPVPLGVERLPGRLHLHRDHETPVLQVGLLALKGQYNQGWNLVAAGSFVVMIIPLIVFFSLQRFFVRGLTAGSVK